MKTAGVHEMALFMGVVVASSAFAANYELDLSAKVLNVTVESGEENFDDGGYASYLTGNIVTNVVKCGAGVLVMGSADRSSYNGDFTLEAGTLTYSGDFALGSLDSGTRTIFVRKNATLARKDGGTLVGKTVYFEGVGANGEGAHWASGNVNNPWGQNVAMTGDALISGDAGCSFTYGTTFEMAGHTLTVRQRTDNNAIFGLKGVNFYKLGTKDPSPGTIVAEDCRLHVADGRNWNTSDGVGALILTNATSFRISGFDPKLRPQWSWVWASTNAAFELSQNVEDKGGEPYQIWEGPFEIRGVPVVNIKTLSTTPRNADVSFAGKVSGGGFYIEGSGNDADLKGGNPHLHLLNSANDFTNGIVAVQASVHLAANGALPATGGNLVLTNAAVYFNEDETYVLPGLEVSGTGMVSNAKGAWCKGVVKRGVGELCYDTLMNIPSLTIEGGSVRLPPNGELKKGNPRAGLVGGVTYGEYSGCYGQFVTTNGVELSPAALYDKDHTFWTTEVFKPDGTAETKRIVTYAGYLWNRTNADVTWTFAGCCTMHFALYVNGKQEIYQTEGNGNVCVKKAVVLHPGANPIQVRVYAKTNGGPTKNSVEGMAWNRKGFPCYVPTADGSDNQDDYLPLRDPGDGSLLTWILPDEDLPPVVPGSEEPLVVTGEIPEMTLYRGTELDMNGNNGMTVRLAGFTTLKNCPQLSVAESWTVKVTDVAPGGKLTTTGKLVFADGAELVIDGARCKGGEYVVAEASGGIEGDPDLRVVGSEVVWTKIVKDGKITLICPKRGLAFVVR